MKTESIQIKNKQELTKLSNAKLIQEIKKIKTHFEKICNHIDDAMDEAEQRFDEGRLSQKEYSKT